MAYSGRISAATTKSPSLSQIRNDHQATPHNGRAGDARLHSVDTRYYTRAGRGGARAVPGERKMDEGDNFCNADEAGAASSEQPGEEQPGGVVSRCSTGVLTRAVYFVWLFSRAIRPSRGRREQCQQTAPTSTG